MILQRKRIRMWRKTHTKYTSLLFQTISLLIQALSTEKFSPTIILQNIIFQSTIFRSKTTTLQRNEFKKSIRYSATFKIFRHQIQRLLPAIPYYNQLPLELKPIHRDFDGWFPNSWRNVWETRDKWILCAQFSILGIPSSRRMEQN